MGPGPAADKTAVRVGLMGGTFDPPHYAHLLLAEQARETLALERVVFVPSGHPPHKSPHGLTEARHRWVMTELACAEHPAFEVSRLELERPGISYTIDTLRQYRKEYAPGAEMYLLTGMDQVFELRTWKEPEALLAECTVVAARRPGYEMARLAETIGEEWALKIVILEMPLTDISSTDLRARARAGRSLRYLAPPGVEQYVLKHRLYRPEEA